MENNEKLEPFESDLRDKTDEETQESIDNEVGKGKEKEDLVQVVIKCPTDPSQKDFDFTLPALTTIGELKELIGQNLGFKVGKQRLIHAGKILTDSSVPLSTFLPADPAIIFHLAVFPSSTTNLSENLAQLPPSSSVPSTSTDPKVDQVPSQFSTSGPSSSNKDSGGSDSVSLQPQIIYIQGLPYLALPEDSNFTPGSEEFMPQIPSNMQIPPEILLRHRQLLQEQLRMGFGRGGVGAAAAGGHRQQFQMGMGGGNVRIHVLRISPQVISALWTLAKILLFVYLFSTNASSLRISLMLGAAAFVFLYQIGMFQGFQLDQLQEFLHRFQGLGSGIVNLVIPFFATLIPGLDTFYLNQQQHQQQEQQEQQPPQPPPQDGNIQEERHVVADEHVEHEEGPNQPN